jgi:hypothetical protein
MEFSADKITFMWKDANSNTGDCPGISKVPGGYLVQGVPVGPATHEALRAKAHLAADGEAAVFVPDNVIDRLKAEE